MELQGVYGPSKGAVIQIARTMAVDYARDNIRVNAVCPGVVETPLLRRTAVESGDPEKFLGDLAAALNACSEGLRIDPYDAEMHIRKAVLQRRGRWPRPKPAGGGP